MAINQRGGEKVKDVKRIAATLPGPVARELQEEADRKGITFASMISMLLTDWYNIRKEYEKKND
jgi:hypothetical protein